MRTTYTIVVLEEGEARIMESTSAAGRVLAAWAWGGLTFASEGDARAFLGERLTADELAAVETTSPTPQPSAPPAPVPLPVPAPPAGPPKRPGRPQAPAAPLCALPGLRRTHLGRVPGPALRRLPWTVPAPERLPSVPLVRVLRARPTLHAPAPPRAVRHAGPLARACRLVRGGAIWPT